MKRILIIGAQGQLGKSLSLIQNNYKDFTFFLKDKKELDITYIDKLSKEIKNNKINIIINCAAYTDVVKAEDYQLEAIKVNAEGVNNIIQLIEGTNCKLIHISTDYVFDGRKSSEYTEEDLVNPINYYGKTKAQGEQYIIKSNTNSIIIRTSWLFSEFNNNFIRKLITLSKIKDEIQVIKNQFGNPTYADDLAHFCLKLCSEYHNWDQTIFHFTNSGSTSRYLLAKNIADKLKLKCKIVPVDNLEQSKILRPINSSLSIKKIVKVLNHTPRGWEAALDDCLTKIRLENK